ncbi:MAG: acyltransferase [Chthoniobacteraceae bacterium]
MQSNKRHLDFLDLLRGVAILSVFAFHAMLIAFTKDQLPWGHWFVDVKAGKSILPLFPVTLGWAGVAIFFVVSGFCINLSFSNGRPGDWAGFFTRRFFRIYPPYVLALLLFAFFFPLTAHAFATADDWKSLGLHGALLYNFTSYFYSFNAAFWSIAVEAQLYLLYPLLMLIVGKMGWQRALIITGGIEFAMRGASAIFFTLKGDHLPHWFSGSPFFFWFSWSIGAALAAAYIEKRPLPFTTRGPGFWLALAVASTLAKPLESFSFAFFALATASYIARYLQADSLPAQAGFLRKHLSFLGTVSYSFYLLHMPVITWLAHLYRQHGVMINRTYLMFAVCLSTYFIILFGSWLYYKVIELPSIALGKQFLKNWKAAAIESAALSHPE